MEFHSIRWLETVHIRYFSNEYCEGMGAFVRVVGRLLKLKASNIHMQLKIHMSYGCVEIGSNIFPTDFLK